MVLVRMVSCCFLEGIIAGKGELERIADILTCASLRSLIGIPIVLVILPVVLRSACWGRAFTLGQDWRIPFICEEEAGVFRPVASKQNLK